MEHWEGREDLITSKKHENCSSMLSVRTQTLGCSRCAELSSRPRASLPGNVNGLSKSGRDCSPLTK
eukprot:754655-Hanusia_phi.AAC.2